MPGADAAKAARAAALCKADLVTEMVGEFPELQGIMGRYYALHDGEPRDVADAIADHYAPQGPNDRCPTAPESIVVALADKLDTLTGFFAIDETPTGSKDPFALRRAALGVIRLIVENRLRLPLRDAFDKAAGLYPRLGAPNGLLDFFADRLKVHLREGGVRHDLVSAVFALGSEDDLVRLLARVTAVQSVLSTEEGANLVAGVRRASNIVRAEEKKDGAGYDGETDDILLTQDEEKALLKALIIAEKGADKALADEDFEAAMAALAGLRGPVDAFFDKVTVNVDDPALRRNRLALLARVGSAAYRIADFSKIEPDGGVMEKWVYTFGEGSAEGSAEMEDLLGSKGANLAEMSAIGLPVPPGFTITTDVCGYYHSHNGTFPGRLDASVRMGLAQLERVRGARLGDPVNPLLVSVRSGGAASLPGMMDTVLNLGLNDAVVEENG